MRVVMQKNKILAGFLLAAVISSASAEEKFKVCADPLKSALFDKKKGWL